MKNFSKSAMVSILTVLMLHSFPARAEVPLRPNVIFILADDLGFGDLSCYGQKKFTTPNIDQLAADGIRFTQNYSGSTVCAPARCSLLTGLHTGHAPIRANQIQGDEGDQPMPPDTFTLGHLFQNAAYTTGIFGKWGLGAPGSSSEPLDMGFDRFYGYNCQRQAHHYYPYFLWNNRQREILWNNTGLERGDYAPDLIQNQLLQFIEENRDRPFFCYYALIQPHAEMLAPEKQMDKYRGKFLPESVYEGCNSGPKFRRGDYASQPEAHAALPAMINVIDDYIAELRQKLSELGIAENTLIIFSSDNGPCEEGGNDPEYFQSSGPFRGIKRDLYEGGIRTPMIVCWPGTIQGHRESDHLCAFWDIMPTLAELTGQPTPENTDGISILPTLLNRNRQQNHETLYWEFHKKGGRIAIRRGNWKGVRYGVAANPDSPLELYNLTADPGEKRNVADQHPEIVTELDRLIKQSRTESPIPAFNFP